VDSPRAVPAAELQKTWQAAVPGLTSRTADRLTEALQDTGDGPRRLLCGSLYLCGEALSLVEGGAFEASTQ